MPGESPRDMSGELPFVFDDQDAHASKLGNRQTENICRGGRRVKFRRKFRADCRFVSGRDPNVWPAPARARRIPPAAVVDTRQGQAHPESGRPCR